MTVQMTIIGLGKIGVSIGLALQEKKDQIRRVGYDLEIGAMNQARKIGAIDHSEINIHAAVEKADIVVLAVPLGEIEKILEQIGPDLREDAVVIDTSTQKSAPATWAMRILPAGRHFVSLTSSLNPAYLNDTEAGIDGAHADLFKNSTFVITSPPEAASETLRLAADLVSILGGTPMYADVLESDGLFAASDLLPKIAAAALVTTTTGQPGWRDGQRLAGHAYASTTEPALHLHESELVGEAGDIPSENIVRMIDLYIQSLMDYRDAITDGDRKRIDQLLQQARKGRIDWWKQRQRAEPEKGIKTPEVPSSGDIIRRLFVGGAGKPKKPKE